MTPWASMTIATNQPRATTASRRPLPRALGAPRGVALVLVLAVMAIAAIMSMAVLSSAALQAQVKGNAVQAAEAQYLAESGVNLALYYLQNPAEAPVLAASVYPGETGVTFGADVAGTCDITVTNAGADVYEIIATGHAGTDPAGRTSRELKVRVNVAMEYRIVHALNTITNFDAPACLTVNGDVRSDGVFNLLGATIVGDVYAQGSTNLATWITAPAVPARAVPTMAQLAINTTLGAAVPYYNYRDANGAVQVGYPQVLPATVTGTLAPAVTNPMNVWYANDSVTLGDCAIDGTIVIRGAARNLNVAGVARVTPRAGMPGVIVNGSIRFQAGVATLKQLTVDGVCYTGTNVSSTGLFATNCELVVNGALMLSSPSSVPIASALFAGPVTVNYVSANVRVPDLSTSNRVPTSVKIVRWGF